MPAADYTMQVYPDWLLTNNQERRFFGCMTTLWTPQSSNQQANVEPDKQSIPSPTYPAARMLAFEFGSGAIAEIPSIGINAAGACGV